MFGSQQFIPEDNYIDLTVKKADGTYFFRTERENNNLIINSNVDINGQLSYTNLENVIISQNNICLNDSNTADILNSRFETIYKVSGVDKYGGFARSAGTKRWYLYKDVITPNGSNPESYTKGSLSLENLNASSVVLNGDDLTTLLGTYTNTSGLDTLLNLKVNIADINSYSFTTNAVNDLINYTTTTNLTNALNLKLNTSDLTGYNYITKNITQEMFVNATSLPTSSGSLRLVSAGNYNYIQSGVSQDIGSTADLFFTDMSSSNTWMTLKGTTGRLGINTTAPEEKLHVNGSIKADTNMICSTVPTQNSHLTNKLFVANNYLPLVGGTLTGSLNSITTDQLAYLTTISSNVQTQLTSNSSSVQLINDRYTMANSYVGTQGNYHSYVGSPGVNYTTFGFQNTSSSEGQSTLQTGVTRVNHQTPLCIKASKVRISPDDLNVPVKTFEVQGSADISGILTLGSECLVNNKTDACIRLLANTGGNYIQSGTSDDTSVKDLYITSLNGGTEWMRCKASNCFVGVGGIAPSEMLHVNGNIKTNGTIKSDDRVNGSMVVPVSPDSILCTVTVHGIYDIDIYNLQNAGMSKGLNSLKLFISGLAGGAANLLTAMYAPGAGLGFYLSGADNNIIMCSNTSGYSIIVEFSVNTKMWTTNLE